MTVHISKNNLFGLIFVAIISFSLSAVSFKLWHGKGDVPVPGELKTVAGTIERVWVTGRRSDTVRFRLVGVEEYFVYNSISREVGSFKRYAVVGAQIELSYSPSQSHMPLFEKNKYHAVYSVSFPGKWQRSYQEIKLAHENNAEFGIFLALAFFIFPICLLLMPIGKSMAS